MDDLMQPKQAAGTPVPVPGDRLTGAEAKAEIGEDTRAKGNFDPARPDLVQAKQQTGTVPEQTTSHTETSPSARDRGDLNPPEGSTAVVDPVITASPD